MGQKEINSINETRLYRKRNTSTIKIKFTGSMFLSWVPFIPLHRKEMVKEWMEGKWPKKMKDELNFKQRYSFPVIVITVTGWLQLWTSGKWKISKVSNSFCCYIAVSQTAQCIMPYSSTWIDISDNPLRLTQTFPIDKYCKIIIIIFKIILVFVSTWKLICNNSQLQVIVIIPPEYYVTWSMQYVENKVYPWIIMVYVVP